MVDVLYMGVSDSIMNYWGHPSADAIVQRPPYVMQVKLGVSWDAFTKFRFEKKTF